MRFTILIAAFRAGPYIFQALQSVRSQSYEDWEVIVVEDGSQDETQAIVEAFSASVPQPVRYERFAANQGVSRTRNRLLQLASSPLLAFLDADDWWEPGHLQFLAAVFVKGADVSVSRTQLYDLSARCATGTVIPPNQLATDPVQALFEESCIITSSSVAFRSELAGRVGWFDPELQIGEDRDFWMRCALAGGRFAESGAVTCIYARHAANTMSKTLLWAQQEVAFYEKYRVLKRISGKERRSRLAHTLMNLGRLLRASDPVASTMALWRAWKLAPWDTILIPHLVFSAGSAALRVVAPVTRTPL